jgi:hypothetical protein
MHAMHSLQLVLLLSLLSAKKIFRHPYIYISIFLFSLAKGPSEKGFSLISDSLVSEATCCKLIFRIRLVTRLD